MYLHSYSAPAQRYVETKVGGHAFDQPQALQRMSTRHRSTCYSHRSSARYYSNTRSSLVFQYVENTKRVQSTTPIKLGGHALDHVRFLGRGLPSRPLLSFTSTSSSLSSSPVVTPYRTLNNNASSEYCARCHRHANQQTYPLVPLACAHRYCATCLVGLKVQHVSQCSYIACITCIQWIPCFGGKNLFRTVADHDQAQMELYHRYISTCLALFVHLTEQKRKKRKLVKSNAVLEHFNSNFESPVRSTVADQECWKQRLASVDRSSKLHQYEFLKTIGRGNFAQAYLVKRRRDDALVVLKESDQVLEALNEIKVFLRLGGRPHREHHHVLAMYDFFAQRSCCNRHTSTVIYIYIEMEFCNAGNLKDHVDQCGGLTLDEGVAMALQLCQGLRRIHDRGIVHGDFKPENVLLHVGTRSDDGNTTPRVKIGDFGMSSLITTTNLEEEAEESGLSCHDDHAAGTWAYMAPEIRRCFSESLEEEIQPVGGVDFRSDIYSLGMVMLGLFSPRVEPRLEDPLDEHEHEMEVRNVLASLNLNSMMITRAIVGTLRWHPTNRMSLSTLEATLKSYNQKQKRSSRSSSNQQHPQARL